MAVRDLGYRAYEGARLPQSHSFSVLYRFALGRAWRSWLVKTGVLLSVLPLIGLIVGVMLAVKLSGQSQGPVNIEAGEMIGTLQRIELWLSVTLITLGAGASVIAQDRVERAFAFFFSKPVTASQYIAANALAIGTLVFAVSFLPGFFLWLTMLGVLPAETRVEQVGVILPTLLNALLIAAFVSPLVLASSALGRSRAVTMSSWILAFIVPHALALLVHRLTDKAQVFLLSVPGLLGAASDALFRTQNDLPWWQALIAIVALLGGALFTLKHQIDRAEVVT